MNRPRSVLAAAVAALALVSGMTACASTPGNRRVVTDAIEGWVANSVITESEGQCMRERLRDYSDDTLRAIAAANDEITQTDRGQWTEELLDFEADFAECVNGEVTESTGTTEPGGTEPAGTEPTETTEPPESTEPTGTT